MKKIFVMLCVCLTISLLSSCKSSLDSKGNDSTECVELESNSVEYITKLKADPQAVQLGEIKDTQAYFATNETHCIAYYDGGYYYMTSEGNLGKILSYFDPKTGLCTPVCAQPQCDHKTVECTAIFSDYSGTVWCYKEKLYFVRFGNNGKSAIVESNLDGTGRKELFEIGNNPMDLVDAYNFAIADDYFFIYNRTGNYAYTTDESMKVSIRMISLDGTTDRELVVSYEKGAAFEMLKVYRNNLFFVYTNTHIDEKSHVHTVTSQGLYCYDIVNDKIHKVIDDAVYDLSMDEINNVLYYFVIGEGVYSYDFDSNITRKIYESDKLTHMCNISYDGKYIYLSNARCLAYLMDRTSSAQIIVLNTEGKLLNSIEKNKRIYSVYFGDSKHFLTIGSNDEDRYADGRRYFHRMEAIKYIDKCDILTTDEWKQSIWND